MSRADVGEDGFLVFGFSSFDDAFLVG